MAVKIAPMPEAAKSAASPPSSAAMVASACLCVGLP
jgi:hypothetical protein